MSVRTGIDYTALRAEVRALRDAGTQWRDIADKLAERYRISPHKALDLAQNLVYRKLKEQPNMAATNIATAEDKEARIAKEKAIREAGRCYHMEPSLYIAPYAGEQHIRIGVISDTHFGSYNAQYTHLKDFYERCKTAGITDIYHCGDLDDGSERMHAGIQYERHVVGVKAHIDNVVAHYPAITGITSHILGGNHDKSFAKDCGLDIVEEVALRRPDMHYIGLDRAIVTLAPGCRMELRHPGDGCGKTISLKAQGLVDGYASDTDKPDIMCIGHYHKAMYLVHRGVHTLYAGSFCGQTAFMLSKNLLSVVGGWILDINLDSDGNIRTFTPTFVGYTEIKNDYKNQR